LRIDHAYALGYGFPGVGPVGDRFWAAIALVRRAVHPSEPGLGLVLDFGAVFCCCGY